MAQEGSSDSAAEGKYALLHRIDAAVYRGERLVVVAFLTSIAVTMFVDVAYGRLVAQDSKIGKVLAKLAGISDLETRAWIDTSIAPWVGLVLGAVLLWFGFWTAERHKGEPFLKIKHSALAMAAMAGLAIAAVAWIMTVVESVHFYLIAYGVVAAIYVGHLVRHKPEHWQVKAGTTLLVVSPIYVWLALTWIPEDYTWSQELSQMMLLWIGFLGASVCAFEGKHLRMEAFDRILPPKSRRWVHAAGFLAAAGFSGFMCLLGYKYVTSPGAATHSSQMNIPDSASIVAVPIAFFLTTVRFVAAAASSALGGEYGQHKSEAEVHEEAIDSADENDEQEKDA